MRRLGWEVLAVLLDLLGLVLAVAVGASLVMPYLLTFGDIAAGDALYEGFAPSLWGTLAQLAAYSLALAACVWLRRVVLRRRAASTPAPSSPAD